MNRDDNAQSGVPAVIEWLERASLREAQGRYDEVVRACDEALRLAPDNAEAHNLRGIALDELGDRLAAIEAYRAAVRCDPEFVEARENLRDAEMQASSDALEWLEHARLAEAQEHYREVLRLCDRVLRAVPGNAEAHNLRGIALEELDRAAEALAAYRAAVQCDPDFVEARDNLREAEADAAAEVEERLEQALGLEAAGRYAEALRLCDQALKLAPDHAEFHNLRGVILDETGRKGEAVAAFRMATVCDHAFVEARENLVEAEGEALAEVAQRFERAAALERQGHYRQALRECTQVLQVVPDHAEAREMRARLLQRVAYAAD